jgi:hypothetical protein
LDNCSPAQQRDLLDLAEHQGFLYGHQLPAMPDGDAAGSIGFASLLQGKLEDVQPVPSQPVTVCDEALDAAQRDAVAKTLATPDICLVQGLPGTGKSRVVAEIIIQSVGRGERVLLLAHSAPAIDRILELTQGREEVYAVRCLAPDEQAAVLPAAIRSMTCDERLRQLISSSRSNARQILTAREAHFRRLQQGQPVWQQLLEVAERLEQLQGQRAALAERRSQIPDEVEREASTVNGEATSPQPTPFLQALAAHLNNLQEAQAAIDKSLAGLKQQSERSAAQRMDLQTVVADLQRLAAAWKGKRLWTSAWWKALRCKNLCSRLKEAEDSLQRVQNTLADLDQEAQRLALEREEAAKDFASERRQLLLAEVTRRQTDTGNQAAALAQEQNLLGKKWHAACATLDSQSPRPESPVPAAVKAAQAVSQRSLHEDEKEIGLLRGWLVNLEDTPSWSTRLRQYANVVAATALALAADPHFGNRSAVFDLLILQEADQFTDAELRLLLWRGRRWMFVGEPVPEVGSNRSADRAFALRKPSGPAVLSGPFQSLWRRLHWHPRALPYAWVHEGDRLCCRLKPINPDHRRHLETESVADFPDIELRILTIPGSQPQLAEIVFPSSFSIEDAKAYVFRELDELAVQTAGYSACWTEHADRLVLGLGGNAVLHPVAVVLEPGVREIVGDWPSSRNGSAKSVRWQTCCLEFDRAAGWDRPRAEAWLQQHLGIRDLGRTAYLDVAHRMCADLAAFLSGVLFGGRYREQAVGPNGFAPCVEFVPVPALRDRVGDPKPARSSSTRGGAAQIPRKGGAGLEIDLADPRQRARLPANLTAQLPTQGLVNYPEAQAVVRLLEGLAANKATWPTHDRTDGASRCRIGVMALYSAQIELLRLLIRQSPPLQQAFFEMDIDVPGAFRERECSVVMVSLTRSHSHRPITFGDKPEMLALALTRARSQLILVGDAGSLARRSQWDGPLDHLNEDAAARERDCIIHLVDYLQGQGPHPHTFRLREGVGT